MQEDCLFCQIAHKKAPSHIIWESESFMAFLSIFPNTKGVTVVIPKKHYPSYAFELSDEVLSGLILAAKRVGLLLDQKLETSSRTALVLEGFGVDHVHAKLFPMHGTGNMKEWTRIESKTDKFFENYEGYISSNSSHRADDQELAELAKKIRN